MEQTLLRAKPMMRLGGLFVMILAPASAFAQPTAIANDTPPIVIVEERIAADAPPSVDVNVSVQVPHGAPRQDSPPPSGRGSHFFLEGYAGGTVGGGLGGFGSMMLGAGGKLPWLPLRFYFVGELAYSTAENEGSFGESGLTYRDSRQSLDIATGLRIYAPLGGPFRLFLDALGGTSRMNAMLARESHQTIQSTRWGPLGIFAVGLQYRFLESVSAGLRVGLRLANDPLRDLRGDLNLSTARLINISAGLTWHL